MSGFIGPSIGYIAGEIRRFISFALLQAVLKFNDSY